MSALASSNYLAASGTPRRCRVDLATPVEQKLREALAAVEGLGADERLTETSIKLLACLGLVADYLEETGNVKPE